MYTPGMPYDMCLLKVDGTIDLSNEYVSAIPMGVPEETYAGNKDCWISGWGRDGKEDKHIFKTLVIPYKQLLYALIIYIWMIMK